jgi:hypothetical protein
MQYLMLIYGEEAGYAALTPEQGQAAMAAFGAFTNEVIEKKMLVGSNRLRPVSDATSVRVRDGKTLTTDGPFAETREQLGGYYLLECKDLDEAIEYAAKIPGALWGTIEIRPVWAM